MQGGYRNPRSNSAEGRTTFMCAKHTGATLTPQDKEKIRTQLKELADNGVIDLDAPLRHIAPFIQKHLEEHGDSLEARKTGWYCFIGDIFILCEYRIDY
jgi:hypothetical protein